MKFSYYLVFAFLTLFTPLAFGGSEPWGLLIFNFTSIAFAVFLLFHKQEFSFNSLSKTILSLLIFIIVLAFIQLFNQHNFLQKPAYIPFTLCKYYSLEGLSLLFSLSMLYFALTQTVKKAKEIKILILILTINAIITSFVGIGFRTEYISYLAGQNITSAFGPFTSRNHGAQFVMIAFFLSLFLWVPHCILAKGQRLPNKNIWYLLFSIILFISVFFTHSRGGVIALVLGLFVFSLLYFLFFAQTTHKKIIYSTLTIFTFMISIHLIITYSTVLGLRQFWGGSDNARLALYTAAINMLKDFPFTGVGFDAFSAAIDAYIPFTLKAFPRYLHNDWLELLLSFGYLFGSVILGFILVIIYKIIKLFKDLEPKKKIRLFILCAALSGFTFTGVVDFPFHLPACALLFFCTLAFTSAKSFSKSSKEIDIPFIVKIVIVCCAGILLWFNFQYVKAWRNFVFVKQLAPKIQAKELNLSLELYPSPIYIRHALNGKHILLKSKTITEEEREELKKETHLLTAKYLEQYPKDLSLSRLFVWTK
ncbi:MAG: O-antigen ligase family protein [Elusimicrobiaceae bacterium]|nr:O-antigen ligase family protein [Elusimicrobiaceae bacterium]